MKKLFYLLILSLSFISYSKDEISNAPENTQIQQKSFDDDESTSVQTTEAGLRPGYEINYPLVKNGKPYVYVIRIDCLGSMISMQGGGWEQYGYGTGEDGRLYMIKATTKYSASVGWFVTTYESTLISASDYDC